MARSPFNFEWFFFKNETLNDICQICEGFATFLPFAAEKVNTDQNFPSDSFPQNLWNLSFFASPFFWQNWNRTEMLIKEM